MERVGFELLFKKIKNIAGGGTQKEVAEKLGITPQAISDAKRKNRIPESWYGIIFEQFGVTKETLHQLVDGQTGKVVPLFKNGPPAAKKETSVVSDTPDPDVSGFDNIMDKFFEVVKQWLADENGRSPWTAVDFIQEFPSRFEEMKAWQKKKEKGELFKFDRKKSDERLVKGR